MKKMMIIGVLLICGCATMQVPDTAPVENASYQEIILAPGQSKKQLFEKSKQWLALTFVSAKKVIEYENEAEGKIIGNGSSTITFTVNNSMVGPTTVPYSVGYSMIEDIKDGKARILISNIKLLNMYGSAYSPIYVDGWQQLKPKLEALCISLRSFLISDPENKNW